MKKLKTIAKKAVNAVRDFVAGPKTFSLISKTVSRGLEVASVAILLTFCFAPSTSVAAAPEGEKAASEKVSLNQYGETKEEEAERKALEEKQKAVVVTNNREKRRRQDALKREKSELKNLKSDKKSAERELTRLRAQKKALLTCVEIPFFSYLSPIVSEQTENMFGNKITDSKEAVKDVKSKIQTAKNNIQLLKEEPWDIVFDPQDVTKLSNISTKEMKCALGGTELEKLAPIFVECEQEYGVNAIFLASIAALESNWGTSRRAVEDNNYTGFGVYSETAEGINAKTPSENIIMTAKKLSDDYLSEGGMYNHGVSVFGVNTKYCVGCTWGMKVTNRTGNSG